MDLYVFNPDTDLALANNEENYMAPASARRMAQDLALLPVWYARPGSAVLAPSAYHADFLKRMKELFPLSVELVTEPELPDYAGAQIVPWGWNPAFRKRMLKGGIEEHSLPGMWQLEAWRGLAGRHTAQKVLDSFRGMDDCCGEGACLSGLPECGRYRQEQGPCVFKAPWSGSGKGLLWCRGSFDQPASGWCRRVIAEQGFLVGTPIYNRVLDFAMEFYADGCGQVAFAGYSLFMTNAKGGYVGNELVPDESVEQRVAHYVPLASLWRIREHLQGQLSSLYAGYAGYLGVDMMVCLDDKACRYAVFPCVEINVRMNMGVVARLFYDRFLLPSAVGTFCIDAFATNDELRQAHEADQQGFPAVVRGGKLLSGYLPLVPVTPKSRYRAYVRVGEW